MAKTEIGRTLTISAITGVVSGKNVIKTQKYSNVKLKSTDQEVYNVGKSIGTLLAKETGTEIKVGEQVQSEMM